MNTVVKKSRMDRLIRFWFRRTLLSADGLGNPSYMERWQLDHRFHSHPVLDDWYDFVTVQASLPEPAFYFFFRSFARVGTIGIDGVRPFHRLKHIHFFGVSPDFALSESCIQPRGCCHGPAGNR